MARMLERILDSLSHDVEIDLSLESVSFRCAGRSVSFAPVVHLSAAEPRRLVAVGNEPSASEPCLTVRLFSQSPPPVPDVSKEDCLEGFFRYAVGKVGRTSDLVRPRMIILGTQMFRDVFCGYEQWIFREMAMRSGARKCEVRP